MRMMSIEEAVRQRILILDGAMGTLIQRWHLAEADFRGGRFANLPGEMKGNNDMLNLTQPEVIRDIYRQYLEAGADIITTNTFSSQKISQADYHLEDYAREMAHEGARLARVCADEYSVPGRPRYVAGSVGPTNKACSMSPDVTDPAARALDYDTLRDAYMEQIEGLVSGGVDAILLETIFDTLNCKAGIDAALTVMERMDKRLPIMLSVTVSDLAGRTLSGQTLEAFLASVQSYPLFSVGLNCSFGARQMKPFLRELASKSPYYISVYPNAGLPNSLGQYDETADTMASQMAEYVDEGLVNIMGGCCGTTPQHIAAMSRAVEGLAPRKLPEIPVACRLSGLEPLNIGDDSLFVNVGERTNVTGSAKFKRLIKEEKYSEALDVARQQVENGADGYGYLFWRGAQNSFRADGKYGQFAIVLPDDNAVIAVNAECREQGRLLLSYIDLPVRRRNLYPGTPPKAGQGKDSPRGSGTGEQDGRSHQQPDRKTPPSPPVHTPPQLCSYAVPLPVHRSCLSSPDILYLRQSIA